MDIVFGRVLQSCADPLYAESFQMKTTCVIRTYLLRLTPTTRPCIPAQAIAQPAAVPSLCCDSSHTATIRQCSQLTPVHFWKSANRNRCIITTARPLLAGLITYLVLSIQQTNNLVHTLPTGSDGLHELGLILFRLFLSSEFLGLSLRLG